MRTSAKRCLEIKGHSPVLEREQPVHRCVREGVEDLESSSKSHCLLITRFARAHHNASEYHRGGREGYQPNLPHYKPGSSPYPRIECQAVRDDNEAQDELCCD